ncbi:MAG TPA: glycosyltransferase [Gemmatimonadaceae bacterium]|nr:glycosyltransferase [Gemmatimonadaceae bacterium]
MRDEPAVLQSVQSRRVEMVLPSLIAAGMEMVTARLALGLRDRGWDVGVTCLIEDGDLAVGLRAAGIRVNTVAEPGFGGNFRPRHLERWFREVRPDVVHVHSGAWIKGTHAARRAGVRRVVFTEHGLLAHEPWFSNLLKRWGAAYSDRVVAVSAPLAQHLRRAGVPARKLRVVLNGVNVETFAPRPRAGVLRRELGIGQAFIMGHVARLAAEKNQMLLLDAFARVARDVPGAHLVIAGDGPLRESLRMRATASPAGNRIHFLGVRGEMAELYREFDLFVLPSLAEGTSMSVLEAMASGLSIVATAVGGTPDLLDGGKCGVLVPAGDAEALASALIGLTRDDERRTALGCAARKRAVECYSEERMVEAYLALYEESKTSQVVPERGELDPCAA